MAKLNIILVLSLSIIGSRSDDENPFLDLASSFIQNMGNGEGNGMDNIAAIGSIMGSLMQNNQGSSQGNPAGDIMSGIGSLLGSQDGKGLNPALVGSMISMFAQQMATEEPQQGQRQKRSQNNNDLNLDGILNLASNFLGNSGNGAVGILPTIMSTLNSLSEPEVQKRSHDHKGHASFLPPFLEKVHLYWDIFINSELGKIIWDKSGLKTATKAFTGSDGKISFEMVMSKFENHSFRRHWIKAAAGYLTDMVIHMTRPDVYQKYMVSAEYIINGFLDTQGLPKTTHLNLKKPEKSINALLNYILRNKLDIDTDVSQYVNSAVAYVKQLLKMAESTTSSFAKRGDYQALVDKVTDTLNLEVIEPVLRVYRAYKHSVNNPQCQKHLLCLVNRNQGKNQSGLPGFKAGLTKVSSIAASAALSYQQGAGFWDLYTAIQNDVNCEETYPADCNTFHEHELKVTTEVYHNEL